MGGDGGGVDQEAWWRENQFQDHTLQSIETVAQFEELAFEARGMKVVKFWVAEPLSGLDEGWSDRAMSRFYDGRFFHLHDELYWFRLLKGQPVWGIDTMPHSPPLMGETIEQLYQEVTVLKEASQSLPLDLRFTRDGRLYSRGFYDAVLGSPRRVIVGSVLSIPAREGRPIPEAIWAFELEYSDEPTQTEIRSIRDVLEAVLPPEAKPLRWLARSPAQEMLLSELAAQGEGIGLNGLTYRDLVVPGEAEVYSDGVTAGRLRLLEESTATTRDQELLIFPRLPDDLPPCRGLLTAVPQTPLAHLNLLARNRGIPNVYVAAIDQNPAVQQLSTIRAPTLLWTQSPAEWLLLPLTNEEYDQYEDLLTPPSRTLESPNLSQTPYVLTFSGQTATEALTLRPLIGGKAAGVMMIDYVLQQEDHLNEQALVAPPDPTLSLTGRSYREHVSQLEPILRRIVTDSEFKRDQRLRTLALEGWNGLRARDPSAIEMERAQAWFEERRSDEKMMIERGGAQGWIRSEPIPLDVVTLLREAAEPHFVSLHPEQGLRARSSSNVEDLEGFNGAGLYGSFTGFLYPRVQPNASDQGRDLTRAIREVWASYWGLAAYEERESEGIEHWDGWMGVLIHPKFDNQLERHNGVLTLTLMPTSPEERGHPSHDHSSASNQLLAVATLNSQLGDVSVTNPDQPDVLPELVDVRMYADEDGSGAERIEFERSQRSSLSSEVLSSDEVHALSRAALKVTQVWLDTDREFRSKATQSETLTLDFEYRGVMEGWPKRRLGEREALPRVILKQARPLEPIARGLPEILLSEPIPVDILRRSQVITEWLCDSPSLSLEVLQIYTDPALSPDLGFSTRPFTSTIRFTDHRDEAWRPDVPYIVNHLTYSVEMSARSEEESRGQWYLKVVGREGLTLPFASIQVDQASGDMIWTPQSREGMQGEEYRETTTCQRRLRYASPNDYLLKLVDQAFREGEGYGSHLR